MIDVYKYLTGVYNTQHNPFSMFSLSQRRSRGHRMKLDKHFSRLDVRKYFFSNRVVDMWNSLPDDVVSAPSVNSFKNRIDRHWSKNYDLLYEPV